MPRHWIEDSLLQSKCISVACSSIHPSNICYQFFSLQFQSRFWRSQHRFSNSWYKNSRAVEWHCRPYRSNVSAIIALFGTSWIEIFASFTTQFTQTHAESTESLFHRHVLGGGQQCQQHRCEFIGGERWPRLVFVQFAGCAAWGHIHYIDGVAH